MLLCPALQSKSHMYSILCTNIITELKPPKFYFVMHEITALLQSELVSKLRKKWHLHFISFFLINCKCYRINLNTRKSFSKINWAFEKLVPELIPLVIIDRKLNPNLSFESNKHYLKTFTVWIVYRIMYYQNYYFGFSPQNRNPNWSRLSADAITNTEIPFLQRI